MRSTSGLVVLKKVSECMIVCVCVCVVVNAKVQHVLQLHVRSVDAKHISCVVIMVIV
jgi:hypothetical protein